MEGRLICPSPRQRAGTQRPVCQDVFDEAEDHRVGTSTVLTCPSPMWLFLFPKINSALKGSRFESVDAGKAKATELINRPSEDDLQHCFQQWGIRMERCRVRGGEYIESDDISIVYFFNKKMFLHQSGYFITTPRIFTPDVVYHLPNETVS